MKRHLESWLLDKPLILLLILLVSNIPVVADELDDLKKQVETLAKRIEELEKRKAMETGPVPEKTAPARIVESGRFPGSIQLPGTDTSFRIGGFIESAIIYDIGPRPTSRGGDIAAARRAILEGTPEYDNRGDTRFTARNSRFNIETRTPTRLGNLKTFIEADFNGPPHDKASRATNNRSGFSLRHAYAELGNILFGHYWSNFSDNSVFPNKVDGTGPVGRTFVRQGQLRYSHPVNKYAEFAVALENPHGDFADANDDTLDDSYPDLTMHYRHETDRWHLQFSGMLRRMGRDDATAGTAFNDHVTSWGLNQSGAFHLPGSEDRLSWYLIMGDGIGRYLEGGSDQGASIQADNSLDTQFSYGGFITYRHWWTEYLSSNIDFGYSSFNLNPGEVNEANRKLYSSHVNLFWMPLDNLELGFEYIWAHRKVHDGREGEINRLQLSSVIDF